MGLLADTTSREAHAAPIGADIATIPSTALFQMAKYPPTDKGIRTCKEDETRTSSVVMCSTCDHMRFIEMTHLFTREHGREIRL